MDIATVVIIALALVLLGALPMWPYSARWGYVPGGLVAAFLLLALILLALR